MAELMIGIKSIRETTVNDSNTALTMGSGELKVFATPALLALMEKAASESIKEYLSDEFTTVGSKAFLSHIAPTPVGMSIKCESELTLIDGKRLEFKINAYDEKGLIGKAEHERFIVPKERFTEKAYSKLK